MNILRILLAITYYFFIFFFSVFLVFLGFILFDIFPIFTNAIRTDFGEDFDYLFSIEFYIALIALPLYLIMLKKMRALVLNFSKKEYFSLENSKYTKQIGCIFISIYVIEHILSEYLILFIKNNGSINIFTDINLIEVFLVAYYKCIIGLLLLSIGKAFELGLKQQQENELTI